MTGCNHKRYAMKATSPKERANNKGGVHTQHKTNKSVIRPPCPAKRPSKFRHLTSGVSLDPVSWQKVPFGVIVRQGHEHLCSLPGLYDVQALVQTQGPMSPSFFRTFGSQKCRR